MDDELVGRLRALHDRAPEGRPDLARVLRGGRRRKLRRRMAASGLVLVTTLAGVVTIPQLADGDRATGPDERHQVADDGAERGAPAEREAPTYELFDFEVLYPWAPVDSGSVSAAERDSYCSIRSEWHCGHRRRQAGFSYRWRWATNEYPGEVQCRVRLASADGSVVGRARWLMSGLEPESRAPDVIGVHVSGRPVTARAECAAGAYSPGPGVRVEFVRAEPYTPTYVRGATPPEDWIRLIFEAEALTEDEGDSRMCFMKVRFESGRVVTSEFTSNRGEGTWEFETGHPVSDPVVDAAIRCRALRAGDS